MQEAASMKPLTPTRGPLAIAAPAAFLPLFALPASGALDHFRYAELLAHIPGHATDGRRFEWGT